MFVMYDSVTLTAVPKNPHAVAAYVDGKYANIEEARHMFPHARILPISVGSGVPCACYDIETGDYKPNDVPVLYARAIKENIWRPCFYANLSTMPEVRKQIEATTSNRASYRLWVAYYNN